MAYDLQTAGDAFTLTLSGTVDLTETSNVKDLLKNERSRQDLRNL